MTFWTLTETQPTTSPRATPPMLTTTKLTAAAGSENAPVISAATANLSATSAEASFTRLSPSSTVTIRRGTPRLCVIAVAATAPGGETIAPKANAAATGRPAMECAIQPTTTVVNSTSPIASRLIGRILAEKSRQEVNSADGKSKGGRNR